MPYTGNEEGRCWGAPPTPRPATQARSISADLCPIRDAVYGRAKLPSSSGGIHMGNTSLDGSSVSLLRPEPSEELMA